MRGKLKWDFAAQFPAHTKRCQRTGPQAIGRSRLVWADILAGDGGDSSLDAQRCQIGLQRGCVTIASLMQMRCANFRWFFCNGFAQVSQTKRRTFASRSVFVRRSYSKSCDLRRAKGCPDERMLLAAKASQVLKGRKQGLFHTLCTCGADASRAERFYPIGVRRSFSAEHCLRMRLRALTACRDSFAEFNFCQGLERMGVRLQQKEPVRLSGCWSFLLSLSITKLDPDAGHARRLIQRTNGLAEARPELGCAVLVGVRRGRCDR